MAPHADVDMEPQVTGVTDTSSFVVPDPILNKHTTSVAGQESIAVEPRFGFTIEDVLPHRQTCAPLATGVAPFSSADLFKSSHAKSKPSAKRWDDRFTLEASARQPSSLKNAMKYFTKDIISLCGGLPSSDYFPFESISQKVPTVPDFSESVTQTTGQTAKAGKHDVRDGDSAYDLSIALNYGQSMGPPQLNRFITEHNEIVHNPPYGDWDVCLTVGSTSALDMSLRMFCDRGDSLLTEEYSFSSAIETAVPMGITPVGIKMDEQGLLPEYMDDILSAWNEAEKGKKPGVLYTVPTGQNPTSSTQSLQRRKDIYAVAEKHDLIILEDEPYYFLQMEDYISGHTHEVAKPFKPVTSAELLNSLIPSYLSLDTSGRVIRMDSFSKIIAPGSRTGWITAPAQIVERFIRHQEVSSQTPSGFSIMALFKLLEEQWGHDGFLAWLGYIRAEYSRRRDIMVNACEKFMPTEVSTWVAPKAGMFHWIRVDASQHPRIKALVAKDGIEALSPDTLINLEESVFLAAVKQNVLIARGSWFRAEKRQQQRSDVANKEQDANVVDGVDPRTTLYFRMTFAAATEENLTEAVRRFGDALRDEFGLTS